MTHQQCSSPTSDGNSGLNQARSPGAWSAKGPRTDIMWVGISKKSPSQKYYSIQTPCSVQCALPKPRKIWFPQQLLDHRMEENQNDCHRLIVLIFLYIIYALFPSNGCDEGKISMIILQKITEHRSLSYGCQLCYLWSHTHERFCTKTVVLGDINSKREKWGAGEIWGDSTWKRESPT